MLCTCVGPTEAYDLDPATNSEGRSILAEIMSVAEKFRERVTIILAGYQDDIEKKLFAFNVGLASRFEVRARQAVQPRQCDRAAYKPVCGLPLSALQMEVMGAGSDSWRQSCPV